jgi:pimeloyl-ACP methyl ester carboxylesterase
MKSAMAKPTPRPAAKTASKPRPPQEIVDPRWLFKMLGIAFGAALVCGYITASLLFYFTSWQLVLHPTRNPGGGTALPTQRIQFDVDNTGKPRLAGEWYPADPSSLRARLAVLYLRGADGQLDPADGTQIATLHGLGLNVFAFDYTGYGSSIQHPHPSEKQMLQDATAAYEYLANTYNFHGHSQIIVFGSGTGVSIAAQCAQAHADIAGLIGYNADPEVFTRIQSDRRSKIFPLALFHDRFSLDALKSLKQPKLLYTVGPVNAARSAVYRNAADPKLTVEVPTHNAEEERKAVVRFLDENFPASASGILTPQMPARK